MNKSDFETLEKLNAQIDVWIDEEQYDEVKDALWLNDNGLEDALRACFNNDGYCANVPEVAKAWQRVIDDDSPAPIAKAQRIELAVDSQVDEFWSRLLYAKLLRSHIQDKGTDCYFHLLDEVVTYLENNLPRVRLGDVERLKLIVFYRLELAASASPREQLGFARRAEARLQDSKHFDSQGEAYVAFYKLVTSYNIGLAHFHEARYQDAVLEFNRIIRQVREWRRGEQPNKKLEFYEDRLGDQLLLLPAILYRADVQLKLQLAYHALETVNEADYSVLFDDHCYKKVYRDLIRAQAYQQMGWFDRSWKCLGEVCLGISSLEGGTEKLGERKRCEVPQCFVSMDKGRRTRKIQSLSVFMEDHLKWLMSEDNLASKLHLLKLAEVFSGTYFELAQHDVWNRNGYYQQLARYLSWIAKEAARTTSSQARGRLLQIGRGLHDQRKAGWLDDEGSTSKEPKCRWCSPADVLPSMRSPHYESFTVALLTFYTKMPSGKLAKDLAGEKDKFILRLIHMERSEGRNDLRFRDLELRYQSSSTMHRIDDLCRDDVCDNFCFGRQCQSVKGSFANLMKCAMATVTNTDPNSDDAQEDTWLDRTDYEHILRQWGDNFRRQLVKRSRHQSKNRLHFFGLRRWNSSSPAKGRSVGGGYLLYHTDADGRLDMGLAIDPGFDFLRNLFHSGFNLDDIDIVLISHAHVDHVRDFESIVQLLLELSTRHKKERRIHAVMTLGVYHRLRHIFENPVLRRFVEPYIIDINREVDEDYWRQVPEKPCFRFAPVPPSKNKESSNEEHVPMYYQALAPGADGDTEWNKPGSLKVQINPTQAYHNDYTEISDSFGFQITVSLPEGGVVRFGYTGDTKWVYPKLKDPVKRGKRDTRDIAEQYSGCDAVLLHLGSLIDMDGDKGFEGFEAYDQRKCEDLIRKKNHLYLFGMLRLLKTLRSNSKECGKQQLILLGEFGEELGGGIRRDLTDRLNRAYQPQLCFLPVDVGMDVQLCKQPENGSRDESPKVQCVQCEEFVEIGSNRVDFATYGVDEALCCVCKTCMKSTPLNVLQARLRQLYEVGRDLKT